MHAGNTEALEAAQAAFEEAAAAEAEADDALDGANEAVAEALEEWAEFEEPEVIEEWVKEQREAAACELEMEEGALCAGEVHTLWSCSTLCSRG